MKTFLSYNFHDLTFVSHVNKYLSQQKPRIEPYFYTEHRDSEEWQKQLKNALAESEVFILFLGNKLGETQESEMKTALLYKNIKHRLWIKLCEMPDQKANDFCNSLDPVRINLDKKHDIDSLAVKCVQNIMRILKISWIPPDDIPSGYLFDYEKDIIKAFIDKRNGKFDNRILFDWPKVEIINGPQYIANPLSEDAIGEYRSNESSIIVGSHLDRCDKQLTFPEAGPRAKLSYPNSNHNDELRVGIVVSGGIAPGINAVIDGIVKRHHLYSNPPEAKMNRGTSYKRYNVRIYGYQEGFNALLRGAGNHILLKLETVKDQAHKGGSMLGTSRAHELLSPSNDKRMESINTVIQTLEADHIEILYVIGGDGSMRAAHAIYTNCT